MDGPDSLRTDWLGEYHELSVADALSLAEAQGRPARVIHPGEPITLSMNRQRLNIYVDALGVLIEVHAG